MRRMIVLSCAVLVCGCTSVSPIDELGHGRYSVSGKTRNPFVTWGHVLRTTSESAERFCSESDKQMHQIQMDVTGVRGWSTRAALLRFECDPRWR